MKESKREVLKRVYRILRPFVKIPAIDLTLFAVVGYRYVLTGAYNVWQHPLSKLSRIGVSVLLIFLLIVASLGWELALGLERHKHKKPRLMGYGGYLWYALRSGSLQPDCPMCPTHKYFLTQKGDTFYCTKDESEQFAAPTVDKLTELRAGAFRKAQSERA
ncbi:MAG: hypothetical protein M1378_13600 [Bacteroidetes bacterium]|nr:hypothetical protein [Bacteroidota bacterium]